MGLLQKSAAKRASAVTRGRVAAHQIEEMPIGTFVPGGAPVCFAVCQQGVLVAMPQLDLACIFGWAAIESVAMFDFLPAGHFQLQLSADDDATLICDGDAEQVPNRIVGNHPDIVMENSPTMSHRDLLRLQRAIERHGVKIVRYD